MPITVGIVLIFAPFNFTVLFGLRNKGHANIKGFTVTALFKSEYTYINDTHTPV